ncbi:hypothetical protein ALC53_01953 [Atta colombica]|uniref:Transmembrane protein n=1 Tax=Atta colombica TaxID=520822 RepID=A0A195BT82_9HYME|nr:hypothetical protein ALC53_01953 [Atta colombica]
MNPARFPSCSSLSLSLSLFLSLYLLTQRQLSPVGFDPCGVYDLLVQSAFFRRFLREPCEIYLGRFYCFMSSCAGRGVPSDASITGSELHPGSLRTGPTVSREERRRLKRKREKQTDRRYDQNVLHGILRNLTAKTLYGISLLRTWIFIVATATLTERTLLILLLSGVLAFMAKKGTYGRGTFKNFKWEWTKGSICLRSRVFHRPCRQLAAVLLKTISIPSRDTHFLSPFFQLHLFLSLSRITSQIVSSRSEDEARGNIGNFYCCH